MLLSRSKNPVKASCDGDNRTTEMDSQASGSAADAVDINNESVNGKVGEYEPEGAPCLQDRLKWLGQHVIRKVLFLAEAYPFSFAVITKFPFVLLFFPSFLTASLMLDFICIYFFP